MTDMYEKNVAEKRKSHFFTQIAVKVFLSRRKYAGRVSCSLQREGKGGGVSLHQPTSSM